MKKHINLFGSAAIKAIYSRHLINFQPLSLKPKLVMEIMPTARTTLYLVTAFYIMTATPSLVTAAPTTISSTPATITTSPGGMNENPAVHVITFNQSQCPDPTNAASQVNAAKDSLQLCYGHYLAVGVINNTLEVSNIYYHHHNIIII